MKRLVRLGLAAGLLGASFVEAQAQFPTFRTETELVNLNVTVVGSDAQPVQGLTQDQFEVYEDGVRQQLEFFAPGQMPLDVVILLDTSASMAGSLGLVQAAAVRFAEALRPQDRAAVMGISNGLRILQTFTTDKAVVADAIRQTNAGGRTPLYSSIYTALCQLEKLQEDNVEPRRQAMVVLSDGSDTASGFGFVELMNVVHRHAVPIYTIAPRPSATIKAQREAAFGETTREQDFELRKLAGDTGARAFFPVTIHELTGIYSDIANELAHQYSLGYQSSNSNDRGFRRIALRVAAPGVKWRTRSGYISADTALVGADLR